MIMVNFKEGISRDEIGVRNFRAQRIGGEESWQGDPVDAVVPVDPVDAG